MRSDELPDFIIHMAPYMEELKRLRDENRRLRFEKFPAPKGLAELFAQGGWGIQQDYDGTWSYSIPLSADRTGGCGLKTAEEAAVAALRRSAELTFPLERELD